MIFLYQFQGTACCTGRKDTDMGKKSAWSAGVDLYVEELKETLNWYVQNVEPVDDYSFGDLLKVCLNGADNWRHYSWSGCSLCYNYDIAQRLCSPSEFKKRHYGAYRPNQNEEWLDVQAMALAQAFRRLYCDIRLNRALVSAVQNYNR